jgi:hypothetical protein
MRRATAASLAPAPFKYTAGWVSGLMFLKKRWGIPEKTVGGRIFQHFPRDISGTVHFCPLLCFTSSDDVLM